jgi:hypothetical protein
LDRKREVDKKRKDLIPEARQIIQKLAGKEKNNSKVLSIGDLTRSFSLLGLAFCIMVFLADACGWLRQVTSDIITKTNIKLLKALDMVFLTQFNVLSFKSTFKERE